MFVLPTKLREELLEFRSTQTSLAEHYESQQNLEMSFLVRWTILEKTIKSIAVAYRREILASCLSNWLKYIRDDGPKPDEEPNTILEKNHLPVKKEFIQALNHFGIDGPEVWAVMDSKKICRRRRNEIAHTGKRFQRDSAYTSLVGKLDKAQELLFRKI